MKLTPKQKAFADYYIELGNAAEAARRAGYSKNAAYSIGDENLRKPAISAYIQQRMAEQDAKRVATADEVLRFYTSVMRGEEKDAFGLDVGMADRIKAADSLMKRFAAAGYMAGTKREDDPITKALREEAVRLENGDL